MSDKLLKRDPSTNPLPLSGALFGDIPVDVLMVDKVGVQDMIDKKVVQAYKAGGSLSPVEGHVPTDKLSSTYEGYVYNIDGQFESTSDFVDYDPQHPVTYPAGTNIVVINTTTDPEDPAVYKYDVLGGIDGSVVRGIKLDYLVDLVPEDGIINIPTANLSTYTVEEDEEVHQVTEPVPGVVYLYDGIDGGDSMGKILSAGEGNAATPKAVYDALSTAEAYFDEHEHTYGLSNAVSTHTQVLTLTETVSGATTASADVVISAATFTVPGIVLLDDSISNTSATTSASIAATPAAVANALSAAKDYTDDSISGLVDSLSVAQTSFLASETLSTHVEEDGIVTVTKQAIAITESQVTDLYTKVNNALSASTFSTRPTTVNTTIDLLMDLITALKGLAPANNTPEEP